MFAHDYTITFKINGIQHKNTISGDSEDHARNRLIAGFALANSNFKKDNISIVSIERI